jgi:SAM-dependent methyltransferase
MHDLLRNLPIGSFVLDLGCANGSFPSAATPATAIRTDREPHSRGFADCFVCSDAAHLPFRDRTFAAIVSNHSLEHFPDLAAALSEIGRVIKPDGWLFVSAPDAGTLTDRIYRWLGRGGGHVNAFRSATAVSSMIERSTGLRHIATKTLCSTLSFLNRRRAPRPLPWRLVLLGGGFGWTLFLFAWISRWADRVFHTRFSVYGWAFYFGAYLPKDMDLSTWRNVCVACGAGHPAALLIQDSRVTSIAGALRVYRCPGCGALNPFFRS